MTTYYCKSGAGAADYNAAHVYSIGDKMVPAQADVTTNVANNRKWVWDCTTGGTTNGAITWAAGTITQDTTTITQNGVVFKARKPGFSSGSTANWAYATIYIGYGTALLAAGDTLYVSNNHNETASAAYNFAPPNVNCNVVCVDDSATPPTAETTGATITTTGNSAITSGGGVYSYVKGLTLVSGSGASGAASITTGSGPHENCSFQAASTGASSITFSGRITGCTFKFGAAGSSLALSNGAIVNGLTLMAGGTSPTNLIGSAGGASIENLDLTNASAGINILGALSANNLRYCRNVRVPASWSGVASSNGTGVNPTGFYNVDYNGTNYTFTFHGNVVGSVVQETTIVRTGGATNGVTAESWKMVSDSSTTIFPARNLATPEFVLWNNTTGSPITVTVKCMIDTVTAFNNDELWLEVDYLGTAGAPLGALITSAKASTLAVAAAVTASGSGSGWTTTGLTNPNEHTLSVTFTPQLVGFIHATVKLCKASKTVYVDPVAQVSGQATTYQQQIPGGMFINNPAGFPAARQFTAM